MKKGLLLLIAPALLLAGGCDNDGYSLSKFWVGMATVENPDGENYFYFDTDNGKRMWTAASALPGYRPEDGQRIIADYTILSDRPAGSSYDHDVKLNRVFNVLTKNVVEITEENTGELGNDPVRVTDIWVGADYLNVEFEIAGQNKRHTINLGIDPSKEYEDGKTHLELRHNAKGDIPSVDREGIVSFNLKSLQTPDKEFLTLVVHALSPESGEKKTYEVVYRFNGTDSVTEREFSFGEAADIE